MRGQYRTLVPESMLEDTGSFVYHVPVLQIEGAEQFESKLAV